jgi:Allene oxide cyclase
MERDPIGRADSLSSRHPAPGERLTVKRLSLVLLLCVAAAACLVPAASARRSKHVTVIEHATTDTTIDVGKKGDSTGDILTFHNKVFNAADTRRVGTDQGTCIRIDPKAGTYECAWSVKLKGGQLMVQGPFYDTRSSVLAVTGGTGKYSAVRGEMGLVSRKGGKEFAFRFRLK